MSKESEKKYLWWVLGVALVGLLDSVWLFILHIGGGALQQVCSFSSTVSCDVLYNKNFSEFLHVPVPAFGFCFYGVVLAVAIWSLRSRAADLFRPVLYLWFLALASVATSLYFGVVSAFVLQRLCPFCFLLYLVSAAFLFFAWKLKRQYAQPWGHIVRYDLKGASRNRWTWGILLPSLVILIAAGIVGTKRGQLSEHQYPVSAEDRRSQGPENAPIVISEFSDYQCPFCRVAWEVLKNLKAELGDQVRLVYKFYPLDSSCNPRGGMHLYSCRAAKAAYCASLQEKFWGYSDLLFTSQKELPDSKLLEFAQAAGLDMGRFSSCLESDAAAQEVQKDLTEGAMLQLPGTPTVFINGKQYSGPLDIDSLKATIAQER